MDFFLFYTWQCDSWNRLSCWESAATPGWLLVALPICDAPSPLPPLHSQKHHVMYALGLLFFFLNVSGWILIRLCWCCLCRTNKNNVNTKSKTCSSASFKSDLWVCLTQRRISSTQSTFHGHVHMSTNTGTRTNGSDPVGRKGHHIQSHQVSPLTLDVSIFK